MTDAWMHPRLTDYWDEHARAIDAGARRLDALPKTDRNAALHAISTAVTEHVRVLPDDVLVQAAIAFVDDLYKAACAIDRWDGLLHDYLTASAGTLSDRLADRGFQLQYLVDNTWEDMSRPLELLPQWYQATGFVYVCPQIVARHLAQADEPGTPADLPQLFARYGDEARTVTSQLVARCHSERRHIVHLDTECVEDSFETAFEAREQPGVITVFRDQPPKPGTQVAAWLP